MVKSAICIVQTLGAKEFKRTWRSVWDAEEAEERPGPSARGLGRAFAVGPDHIKQQSQTSFPDPSSLHT